MANSDNQSQPARGLFICSASVSRNDRENLMQIREIKGRAAQPLP